MDGLANGAATDHDRLGRFVAGNNAARRGRIAKLARITAKLEELRREYDDGTLSAVDASRLRLAAKHLVIAEDAHDPSVCVRSTRTAEMLLSRIKPREALLPTLEELLAE